MNKQLLISIALVVFAGSAGYFIGNRGQTGAHGHGSGSASATEAKIRFWTCSMHPQIQQPDPGKCKICAMDLIPVREGQDQNLGPRELKLSDAAARLADVEIVPVTRRMPVMNVRMVGKIEYDESRLAYISARFPGRIDRLYVDYTGITVKKGDHLASIYSPELLTAQEALIQAKRIVAEMGKNAVPAIRERAEATLQSAREKLRLWDLTSEQIKQIEVSGKPSDHLTIHAPISGVVIHKKAVTGGYLQTGDPIYTIADLSQVWVKLDAYESDLQWVHFGQEVEFETEAYPGEIFKGRITFRDPVLNPKTRTVKMRVNVDNQDGRLKPDMFVRAVVKSQIATGGLVMDPYFAGKWISPMHPEIVSDNPGDCTVCGMALVSAESLGYAPANGSTNAAPLVIPITAPLITGERAVVYVTNTNKPGVFEGREITLGPRAGDVYLVKDGLNEGDLIVAKGNFKIDSAIQILAKPSMMSGERGSGLGTGGKGRHDHGAVEKSIVPLSAPTLFKEQLRKVIEAYAAVGNALDHDQLPDASMTATMNNAVEMVDMKLLTADTHMVWMADFKEIKIGTAEFGRAVDIAAARRAFEHLSIGLINATKRFGVSNGVFEFHCPMAFDNQGASWLQTTNAIRNPYFGASMLKCGKLVERGLGSGGRGQGGAGAGKKAK